MKLSFGHISLNVTNMSQSFPFYQKFLKDFEVIEKDNHYAGFSNGICSIWIADIDRDNGPFTGVATDQAVGLHHFAFKVDTMEELQKWETYFLEEDVEMQKGGITDDDFGGWGIFVRDPDNIRLEIHLG